MQKMLELMLLLVLQIFVFRLFPFVIYYILFIDDFNFCYKLPCFKKRRIITAGPAIVTNSNDPNCKINLVDKNFSFYIFV